MWHLGIPVDTNMHTHTHSRSCTRHLNIPVDTNMHIHTEAVRGTSVSLWAHTCTQNSETAATLLLSLPVQPPWAPALTSTPTSALSPHPAAGGATRKSSDAWSLQSGVLTKTSNLNLFQVLKCEHAVDNYKVQFYMFIKSATKYCWQIFLPN